MHVWLAESRCGVVCARPEGFPPRWPVGPSYRACLCKWQSRPWQSWHLFSPLPPAVLGRRYPP
eukprot:1061903-Lingulodinium_polyedra.AAC.1